MQGPDIKEEEVIPLVGEEISIEKRIVSKGKVRINTVVDVVEELARASIDEEVVEVTRVPMDTVVTATPSIRTEGDLTIIPILKEVLVVEKRLVLAEEIHVRRRISTEKVEVPISLRKQRAVIEEIAPDGRATKRTTHDV